MPPKIIRNPYAKKRKAPSVGPPPSSSSSSASGRPTADRSLGGAAGKKIGSNVTSNNYAARRTPIATRADDTLLPSNYAMVPGSFSQAFTSIDDTDDFRRASESFEKDIRDNNKRESFRLAKAKKGRKSKSKNIFEPQISDGSGTNQSDNNNQSLSSSLSNRDGGGVGKQEHENTVGDADAVVSRQGGSTENDNKNNNNKSKSDGPDVRIHHTMLQPHVLYVSTRQKGNGILPLIRNVPIAYSPMVPDYILGPTSCALFLSIKYHKLYPRYIHRRISELRKDFKLRVLLVLVDVDDNASTLLQLNTIGVKNQLTLILCWSELEAARYLETYKTRDGKDAAPIQKRESANPLDRVTDFLTSGRAGVNKTDSVILWNQFSTVRGIAHASKDELALCVGMGPLKVRRLHEALHKPFSKLRSRARNKEKRAKAEKERKLAEGEGATNQPVRS